MLFRTKNLKCIVNLQWNFFASVSTFWFNFFLCMLMLSYGQTMWKNCFLNVYFFRIVLYIQIWLFVIVCVMFVNNFLALRGFMFCENAYVILYIKSFLEWFACLACMSDNLLYAWLYVDYICLQIFAFIKSFHQY